MNKLIPCVAAIMLWAASGTAYGQSAAFSYQGQLKNGGVPLSGTADFQFTLWDAAGSGNPPVGGAQVGGVQTVNALPVTAGLFNATLNAGGAFGVNAFNGNARWLQIAVRSPAGSGVYTTLAPRHPLTATPYALFALSVPGGVSDGHSLDAADGFPVDALFVDNAGKVGIGTTTPSQLLSLQTPTNSYGLFHTDGVRSLATYIGGGGNGGYMGTKSNHSFHLFANDSDPLLTVHPNRNVGIGTLVPASKLDISASGAGAELLRFSTERPWVFRQIYAGPSAGLQLLSTTGQKPFEITAVAGENVATFFADGPNSRVGIGTTLPASKLDIAASGEGAELLRFSTERPWLFRQVRTGPSAGLQLLPTSGLKKFEITANDGANVATFVADGVNSKVGIGTTDPVVKLHIPSGTPVSPNAGGFIQLGSSTGTNVAIDDDEIMARYNGAPANLYVNYDGGDVVFGGAIDIGYQIVESAGNDAICPAGKKVLSGGCYIQGNAAITRTFPLNNGWHCDVIDLGSGFISYSTYAICAKVK